MKVYHILKVGMAVIVFVDASMCQSLKLVSFKV